MGALKSSKMSQDLIAFTNLTQSAKSTVKMLAGKDLKWFNNQTGFGFYSQDGVKLSVPHSEMFNSLDKGTYVNLEFNGDKVRASAVEDEKGGKVKVKNKRDEKDRFNNGKGGDSPQGNGDRGKGGGKGESKAEEHNAVMAADAEVEA